MAADGTTVRTESGWKEVKSGAIYEVKRGKEPRACRISYVSTFEKAPEFGKELWTEAARRGACDAERVVTLGDGSAWIWNLYAEHFPNRVEILDYYHAGEHLDAVAKANWGESSQEASNWHKKQAKRLLKRDGAKKVLEDLKGLQSKVVEAQKVIDDNIGYFENNLDRMNYYEYRKAGYHIGSGLAESACKHLVGGRLKQSGMTNWSKDGAEAVLRVRVVIENGSFDRCCDKVFNRRFELAA